MPAKEILIGDTLQVTWVSSATVPSEATAVIYNGSDTAVSSITMTSSGNGHYYADYTVPSSAQYMVAETTVYVNSLPYKKRTPFRITKGDVR